MSLTWYFLCSSEEIAFYNGNLREKQTIHATFKKLVRDKCSCHMLLLGFQTSFKEWTVKVSD